MIWIGIGLVVFIIGTIVFRHIAGGFLALIAFIIWRLGLLGIVFSWISSAIRWAYTYIRAFIQFIKYEYFDKGEEALGIITQMMI